MFQIDAQINGKPFAFGPYKIGAICYRRIVVTIMLGERHNGASARPAISRSRSALSFQTCVATISPLRTTKVSI
jgi:hypothetical protein